MTRYRARAVLLLFLLLNLTACQTWQSVSLGAISPAQLIEEDQPDRVRVTGGDVLDLELVSPSVEGDQLVGAGDFSVPLEDILRLEVRGFSLGRTILAGIGAYTAVAAGALLLWATGAIE
ncbi:uncharacterized protein METZ01_LOCUS398320 [marine metagenome]|uniref:Uncharacterized protein n=1 Tax=marine metagenome TaxID=408172 RepID=A0A382VG17_9ZZZZ